MRLRASVSATSAAVSSAENDERDVAAEHALEDRPDDRVVRAAEDHRVDAGARGAAAATSRTASTVASPNGSAPSISGTSRGHGDGDHLDPASTVRDERLVPAARDGRLGREQADPAVARRPRSRARLGLQHADDGDGRARAGGRASAGRRRGVAGDDDELHAAPLEEAADLEREPPDLGEGPRPVRQACVVAEVDDVLVRQRDEDLVEHGEPSDARVEDADRPWRPCARL